jgi:hypothetical protein
LQARGHKVAAALSPWIDHGYDIGALLPSCAFPPDLISRLKVTAA